MRQPRFVLAPMALAAMLAAGLPSTASAQLPAQPLQFSIAAQPLADALNTLARQAGLQMLFPPALVAGRTAPAVAGLLSPRQAVDRLLAGSGLVAVVQGRALVVQEADAAASPASRLAPVTVTAQAERDGITEGTGSLAASTAQVGGKTQQSLREIPKSVTVLARQEIEDKQITRLEEAAAQIAGISVMPGTRAPQMYARGFSVSNLQIDGGSTQSIQFYGTGAGGGDGSGGGLFGLPNLAAYDHVEVLRGADGLFSGNGEPGATVNLVRKRPTRERQFQFSTSAGSWDDYRATLDAAGPLAADGRVRGRAIASWQDSGAWFDTVWVKNRFLYGIVEVDATPDTLLTLGGSYEDGSGSDQERSQTWRAGSRSGQFIGSARNTWNLPWSRFDQQTRQVFGKVEHRFAEDWKFTGNLTWQDQQGSELYARRTWFNSDTGLGELIAWDGRTFNKQLWSDFNLSGGFELFGRRHDVVLGSDYRQSTGYWRSRRPTGDDTVSITDVIPRPSDAELASWTGDDFSDGVPSFNKRTGHYGTVRLHVADPLKIILGGRYSRHTTDDGARSIGKLIPFAGATLEVHPDWTAFASVSEIYQPLYRKVPVGQYNADPALITWADDPTTGRNLELGIKGDLQGGALQLSAALFHIKKRNVWVADSAQGEVTIPGYGTTNMMRPAADVTSRGIDLEAKGLLARGWQLSAGYTFNVTQDNGNDGKPLLEFAPRHTLKAWTTYRLPGALSAWRVGGGIRAFTHSTFQGGYGIADASLDYRIDEHLNLAFIVKNLADKAYRAGDWNGPVWGLPRSFMLTLSGRF